MSLIDIRKDPNSRYPNWQLVVGDAFYGSPKKVHIGDEQGPVEITIKQDKIGHSALPIFGYFGEY